MERLFIENFLRAILSLFMIEIDLFVHYREHIPHVQTPRANSWYWNGEISGKHWSTHEIEIQRRIIVYPLYSSVSIINCGRFALCSAAIRCVVPVFFFPDMIDQCHNLTIANTWIYTVISHVSHGKYICMCVRART